MIWKLFLLSMIVKSEGLVCLNYKNKILINKPSVKIRFLLIINIHIHNRCWHSDQNDSSSCCYLTFYLLIWSSPRRTQTPLCALCNTVSLNCCRKQTQMAGNTHCIFPSGLWETSTCQAIPIPPDASAWQCSTTNYTDPSLGLEIPF